MCKNTSYLHGSLYALRNSAVEIAGRYVSGVQIGANSIELGAQAPRRPIYRRYG